eukprot:TRINITY_DN67659_c6_g7_i1.p1 TRINITY_DN67659_c6_g7~~TRINITY_DN67659_c6_g7_i1.p1  ORF type:complete len:326 (+),score=179.67 TRINITY_DN67659_c6_g7_i1:99-1076(+)
MNAVQQEQKKQMAEALRVPSDVVAVLSNILSDLVNNNDKLPDTLVSKFHSASPVDISIASYASRIHRYSGMANEPESWVCALLLLDRMQRVPNFVLNSATIHRSLLLAAMIATKSHLDKYYANSCWAKIGGITLQEVNSLELELLFMVGFDVSFSRQEFLAYNHELRKHSPAVALEIQQQQQRQQQLQMQLRLAQQRQQEQSLYGLVDSMVGEETTIVDDMDTDSDEEDDTTQDATIELSYTRSRSERDEDEEDLDDDMLDIPDSHTTKRRKSISISNNKISQHQHSYSQSYSHSFSNSFSNSHVPPPAVHNAVEQQHQPMSMAF